MLIRLFQRLAILGLGVLSVWLIVFVVFRFADHRLNWILALSVTYGVGGILDPSSGCAHGPEDPEAQARAPLHDHGRRAARRSREPGAQGHTSRSFAAAFAAWLVGSGPAEPEELNRDGPVLRLQTPYPTAPFSTLYLFGRGQDIGFQRAIDDSPRKRHHVRFWALSLAYARSTVGTPSFWLNTDRPADDEQALWVGAGTKDTGFALTRMTFQITHATDSDTNAERDYIVNELKKRRRHRRRDFV